MHQRVWIFPCGNDGGDDDDDGHLLDSTKFENLRIQFYVVDEVVGLRMEGCSS